MFTPGSLAGGFGFLEITIGQRSFMLGPFPVTALEPVASLGLMQHRRQVVIDTEIPSLPAFWAHGDIFGLLDVHPAFDRFRAPTRLRAVGQFATLARSSSGNA